MASVSISVLVCSLVPKLFFFRPERRDWFTRLVGLQLSVHAAEFVIERAAKHGGTISFTRYEELRGAYEKQQVFPLDLKNGVCHELNKVWRYDNMYMYP